MEATPAPGALPEGHKWHLPTKRHYSRSDIKTKFLDSGAVALVPKETPLVLERKGSIIAQYSDITGKDVYGMPNGQ